MLATVGWIGFGLAVVVGLALDLVGLFGNWIILGAVAAAWALTGFTHFGWPAMLGLTGLAALGEILEAFAAGAGAKRFGGGRGAILSALAGGIAGAIVATPVMPLAGTVVGACAGAFAAAAAHEILLMRRHPREAAWTGFGAALGRIGGLIAKLAMGIGMLIIAAVTYN